jgi:hypothetical protein
VQDASESATDTLFFQNIISQISGAISGTVFAERLNEETTQQ